MKKFKLIDGNSQLVFHGLNWNLCAICQIDSREILQDPSVNKSGNVGAGYKSLSVNLVRFQELCIFPSFVQIDVLDEGHSIEATFIAHEAKYHKSCNDLMLQRSLGQRIPRKENLTM